MQWKLSKKNGIEWKLSLDNYGNNLKITISTLEITWREQYALESF